MRDLSLKFKTEASSAEVLNFNERPTMRFYVVYIPTRKYMHAETLADKTIVFSEREVFKVVVMVTQ